MENKTKMTNVEIFAYIKEKMSDDMVVVDWCDKNIDRLTKDKAKAQAKKSMTTTAIDNDVYTALLEYGESGTTASKLCDHELLSKYANESGKVTTQKLSVCLKRLSECGRVSKVVGKTTIWVAVEE